MKKALAIIVIAAGPIGLIIGALLLQPHVFAVLEPRGVIAAKEMHLMAIVTLLMLIVVVPVFVLTAIISWRYRATNQATYTPEWSGHRGLETIWWGLPIAIIALIATVIWQSSHELDPYRPLASTTPPITIKVIALPWKWLFIYPDQQIATVNFVQFPVNTPVNFQITSDAPMNSFWIPQLGGQIYAMPGMSSQLHLRADKVGTFRGSSANLSGTGFAGMTFPAKASSSADFDRWVAKVQQDPARLDPASYAALLKPSQNVEPRYYSYVTHGLYDTVVMKYMMPEPTTSPTNDANPMPAMAGMK